MNAEFDIKIKITDSGTNVSISTNEMKELDISLFGQILKIFSDIQRRVGQKVDDYSRTANENVNEESEEPEEEVETKTAPENEAHSYNL